MEPCYSSKPITGSSTNSIITGKVPTCDKTEFLEKFNRLSERVTAYDKDQDEIESELKTVFDMAQQFIGAFSAVTSKSSVLRNERESIVKEMELIGANIQAVFESQAADIPTTKETTLEQNFPKTADSVVQKAADSSIAKEVVQEFEPSTAADDVCGQLNKPARIQQTDPKDVLGRDEEKSPKVSISENTGGSNVPNEPSLPMSQEPTVPIPSWNDSEKKIQVVFPKPKQAVQQAVPVSEKESGVEGDTKKDSSPSQPEDIFKTDIPSPPENPITTETLSDDSEVRKSVDPRIPTDNNVRDVSSDTEKSKDEMVAAPEPPKLSKREMKKLELLAEKEERERLKLDKSDKERRDREAREATKRAAAETAASAVTDSSESSQPKMTNRALKKAKEEQAKQDLAKKRAHFDRVVKYYIENTFFIPGVTTELGKDLCYLKFDETMHFLKFRANQHKNKNDEVLAMQCDVLINNFCPLIVNDMRQIVENGHTADSFVMERDLYDNIKNFEHVRKAIEFANAGNREKAEQYARNCIKNYIAIQEEVRRERKEPPVGFKTHALQMLFCKHSKYTTQAKHEVDYKLSEEFFGKVIAFFKASCEHNAFYTVLAEEVSKTKHPVLADDAATLSTFCAIGSEETFYTTYLQLVNLKCTLEVDE